DLLKKYGFSAKKSGGQNFLVDDKSYEAIVEACRLTRQDWVIEIGAGLGTLTSRLQPLAARVIAVERDRDMVTVLRGELSGNVEIAEANALSYDYAAVEERAGRKPIVVGNLPYQIASPILFRLLEARKHLLRLVVMLQKEMVDRIVAAPGTPEYGALGVMVRMFGEPKLVRKVPAVEWVARTLRPKLVGRRITAVETSGKKLRQPVERAKLRKLAVGATVAAVRRIGKYLLIDLSSGATLVSHLGMTGWYLFARPE